MLCYVVLCSSFFTLLGTVVQLWFDYKRDVAAIHDNLGLIETSYIRPIATSVYNVDDDQTALLLKSALKLQDIEYLEIREMRWDEDFRLSAGNPNAHQDIVREFSLEYTTFSARRVPLGKLTAIASLAGVYQRIREKVIVVLLINGVKMFVASFCIFIIIQFVVTRHLIKLAQFAQQLDLNKLGSSFSFNRRPGWPFGETDELDQVAQAFNDMQLRLKEDIERITQTEKELLLKNVLLDAYSETSVDGILIVDENGQSIFFNNQFGKMWNIPRPILETRDDEKMVRHVMAHLKDPERFAERIDYLYKHPAEKSRDEIEFRDGKIIERYSIPLTNPTGEYLGRIWSFRDISERRQLENRLRQAYKMEAIGTLAGGIAHDFNNILGIILGNAELALDSLPDQNPGQSNLEEILTACFRARDVVRQLLSFSRKSDQECRAINLIATLRESMTFLRATIPSDIEIRLNRHADTEVVLADPIRINQVVINICANAAHAMREKGGRLDITTARVILDPDTASQSGELSPGHYLSLTFSDTGPGIPPDIRDRIFEPYFTTRAIGEGSGMGLAVVHGIVTDYGGSVSVNSEPGKGAAFRILLPVADTEQAAGTEAAEISQTGTERILFIDDEASVAEMGKQMLARCGYRVESETDPLMALERFCSGPDHFDLVITDMTMPGMTGDVLAQEILKIRPDMPIIICTGFSEKMTPEKAAEIGIRRYIAKPLSKRDLIMTVRQVLDSVAPSL